MADEPEIPREHLLSDRLEHVREMVRHENDLLNHRVTWMWTLQGLLFGGFALLLDDPTVLLPLLVIPLVGFVSSISIGVSLYASIRILDELNPCLRQLFDELQTSCEAELLNWQGLPKYMHYAFPWWFLPWFMAAVWLVLGIWLLL